MAMKSWAALLLLSAAVPGVARAQSVTTEADVTVGRSSDDVNAAAVQVRFFGATKTDWRVYFEGAWGMTTDSHSDAFGTAYPYDRRARPMEAYTEKTFHPHGALFGFRAGRYRTPFGISSGSDQAYVGFSRGPLIRYGQNFALSNTFLEGGADVLAGTPSANVEASLGTPQDEGAARRHAGLDVVVRAQTYFHSFILGASSLRANPSDPRPFARGRMIFHGVDGRWMRGGMQVRGEWVFGRPFDGVTTRGGYVDVLIHPVAMGRVTALGRLERLDYDAGPFSEYLRRLTVGARVRVTPAIAVEVNAIQPLWGLPGRRRSALDLGLTYSLRFPRP
jgi:hypothetical protein